MSGSRGRFAQAAWLATWAGWLGLFIQQLLDVLLGGLPWVLWLGKLLPLVIFLPGMLRDRLRSYIWLCFVSLLYFITLVERLFAYPGSVAAICGMLAVVLLFCAAMLYVRWRARELRAIQSASAAQGGE